MITLRESGVLFNADDHTYMLGSKQLSGITSVIKERLFPTLYAGVSEAVLAKAAERGTAIHSQCELLDNSGIESDSDELRDYMRLVADNALTHLATEYIVTDGETYASGIDKVYQVSDTEVIIADIKTTSKLETDYVRVQTSVYKYLFERQNPGISVVGCIAIWLKPGKSCVKALEPLPSEFVEKVLYSDEPVSLLDGTDADALLTTEEQDAAVLAAYDAADAARKALIERYRTAMEQASIGKLEGTFIKASLSAPTTTRKFNEKHFAEDYPELYEQYCVDHVNQGRFTIKIK